MDSDLRMTALAKTSNSCKRHTHPLVRILHKDYNRKCSVGKKISGSESQGVCRQDELIGGKVPVVK
jgi:hypothetical protein